MIDPQKINPLELPCFPLSWKRGLPKTTGIYIAIDSKDIIQYIGLSININKRWKNHHRYQQLLEMKGIRLAWLEVSDPKSLLLVEKVLINHFKPKLNNTLTKKSSVSSDESWQGFEYKIHNKGLGTSQKQPPLTIRLTPKIDAIVRSLPDRSDFVREAIAEKLQREGLLPTTD